MKAVRIMRGLCAGLSTLILLLAGCGPTNSTSPIQPSKSTDRPTSSSSTADPSVSDSARQSDGKVNVVATTTMIADLVRVLGGDRVEVVGLMGPGIDPHLYQACAGDVGKLQAADVVVYNGLHLEGKMGEIFEKLTGDGLTVIAIEDAIAESKRLGWEDDDGVHDPHIWFDAMLWRDAATHVAAELAKADPSGRDVYEARLASYQKDLEDTDRYIRGRVEELPEDQRVLITAHDAFNYFGRAYGVEVRGLQGISTAAEAATSDVSALADFIVERKIRAIFVESSVPRKNIEALQAAVRAKGFEVRIGGELYSDSLGSPGMGADTYILMARANVDTIVDALKP